MKNGEMVAAFEREFAAYVGAPYAIALCNGTATLHTALAALIAHEAPARHVHVPPLTMASTSIAVLHAGHVPTFRDVNRATWLMELPEKPEDSFPAIPVALYGLHYPHEGRPVIVDAAQTLQPFRDHQGRSPAFMSYSFQASKILPLGEGGMLVTEDEGLAIRARRFSSLGYKLEAGQPRIDAKMLKHPSFERHRTLGWNYRMNDLTAQEGLRLLGLPLQHALRIRQDAAALYFQAIAGCQWLTPQHVPEGSAHDYWTYALLTDTPERCLALLDAIEKHGGERPYPAWRLTYHEKAFEHLAPVVELGTTEAQNAIPDPEFFGDTGLAWNYGLCFNAESLQPRLLQFQTNDLASAERNAKALRLAIQDVERTQKVSRMFDGTVTGMLCE